MSRKPQLRFLTAAQAQETAYDNHRCGSDTIADIARGIQNAAERGEFHYYLCGVYTSRPISVIRRFFEFRGYAIEITGKDGAQPPDVVLHNGEPCAQLVYILVQW